MRKFITLLSTCLLTLNAFAQTDVTKLFLSNPGFDSNFDYDASSTTAVAQELKNIDGWVSDLSANYTITGVYEFGFKGTFNKATVPAKGYDGEAGGCLAISTGWSQTFNFYQNVTLPAGTYNIKVPTYNGSDKTAATSTLAWIPASGTAIKSKVSSYPIGQWTLDEISFTLDKTTSGKIQIGMVAAEGGSVNSAKLCVDYVQILATNMATDKTALDNAIKNATTVYGDGNGNGAAELNAAIEAAKTVYNDANADMEAVVNATDALNAAIDAYKAKNISEENPLDCTSYIKNASFESNFDGWDYYNLRTQSNSDFIKQGSYYVERWVGSAPVGDAYAKQTVKNLPYGKYKLTVAAQNLLQSNKSKQCTGAYIYAGDSQTPVYGPNNYSVTFTAISGQVEIGFVAENANGNWLALDNFRLYQIGEMSNNDIIDELKTIVAKATELQSSHMSATTAAILQGCIDAANQTIDGTKEFSTETILAIQAAITAAQNSIAEYAALQTAIANSENSYDETKNGAEEFLNALNAAKETYNNTNATSGELADAITALDNALLAFNIANATPGTGTAPRVTLTNSYTLNGATQALVRAAFTGSNILERGVCWSKEHNPVVTDNRTTKNFTLNGTIFHIKGLEPATVYYVRPYVMNKTYTVAYGDEIKVVTHPKGNCKGTWNYGAPTEAANTRCYNAIQETIEYFNEWTGIMGFTLSGSYGAQTPTADCSYGGSMRIGPDERYQAIGTVLHETGHGVGVGTSNRWGDSNVHNWEWKGREANNIYHFLENNNTNPMVGDQTHGWGQNATYDWFVNGADKDKHYELQYIGGCCLLYGLFIDGLCPTWNHPNGVSGYTYNFDDTKKYYLMNKNADCGLGEGLLYQRTSTGLGWKPCLTNETISDSAAWTIEYNASKGYYMFKNVASGKYLTHANGSSAIALKTISEKSSPAATEFFQLMPDRTDVTVGTGTSTVKTHGYWFTWYDTSAYANKSLNAGKMSSVLNYGTISSTSFNYSDSATSQQWIIISEDELAAYQAAAIATGISTTAAEDNADVNANVTDIFSADGTKLQQTTKGVNIIRYSDGTSRKVYVK